MYNYDNIRKTIESIRTGPVFNMFDYWAGPCPSCIAGHAVHAAGKRSEIYARSDMRIAPTADAAMDILGLEEHEARRLFSASNIWTREQAIAELEKLLATEPKPDLNELFGLNNATSKNEQNVALSEAVPAL